MQDTITQGEKTTSNAENVRHRVSEEKRDITQLVLETTTVNGTATVKGINGTEDESTPITSPTSKYYVTFQFVSNILIVILVCVL